MFQSHNERAKEKALTFLFSANQMIDNPPFPKYMDELFKLPRLNADVTGFAVFGGGGTENGPKDIFSKILPTNLYFRKVRISF